MKSVGVMLEKSFIGISLGQNSLGSIPLSDGMKSVGVMLEKSFIGIPLGQDRGGGISSESSPPWTIAPVAIAVSVAVAKA